MRLDFSQDRPPAVWHMDTVGMHPFEPGFYVDVSPYRDLKQRMLDCHANQLRRSGDADFAPLSDVLRHQSETRGRRARVAAAEAFRCLDAFKRARAG